MTSISTNIPSLNAQRQLSLNQSGLATTMQRLSSGVRVNSAKDDAAGLAISERMLSQVKGMAVARRNTNDGISLAQVAEGSMQAMTNILQRGRELAVQAANGTNSASDRKALFTEYSQLLAEFGRIASSTSFNGKPLLNGSFMGQTFQVGANVGETIGLTIPPLRETDVGLYSDGNAISLTADYLNFSTFLPENFNSWASAMDVPDREVSFNGKTASVEGKLSAEGIASTLKSLTGKSADVEAKTSIAFHAPDTPARQITLRLVAGEDYNAARTVSFFWDGSEDSLGSALAAINKESDATGVVAESFFDISPLPAIRLANSSGKNLHIMNDSTPTSDVYLSDMSWGDNVVPNGGYSSDFPLNLIKSGQGSGTFGVDDGFAVGTVSITSGSPFQFSGDAKFTYNDPGDETKTGILNSRFNGTQQLTIDKVGFTSNKLATLSLRIFDAAIDQVTSARASLGAIQSRFDSVISNLEIKGENTAASRSRIVDADYAQETANLARHQIIQNAATAMVAQANVIPQQVLLLLKGM